MVRLDNLKIKRKGIIARYIGFKNEKTFDPETLKRYFASNPGRDEILECSTPEQALSGWNILKSALEKANIVEKLKESPIYIKEED